MAVLRMGSNTLWKLMLSLNPVSFHHILPISLPQLSGAQPTLEVRDFKLPGGWFPLLPVITSRIRYHSPWGECTDSA
jgi:hypothetical protein